MARTSDDRLVQIAADAAVIGTERAASVHGVHARTVRRYCRKVESDPELSARVRGKLRMVEDAQDEQRLSWVEEARAAAVEALQTGRVLCEEVRETRNVEALHDVAGFFKLASDSLLTHAALLDDDDEPEPHFEGSSSQEAQARASGATARAPSGSAAVH